MSPAHDPDPHPNRRTDHHPGPLPARDRDDDPAHDPDRLDTILAEAVELELETGRREETVAEAKRHVLARLGLIVGGSIVTLVGVALLALPGPGLIVVALGLGMLATEVPFAARLLERVRKRLPADADGRIPRHLIVMMGATCVLATGASVWWALR